MSTLFGAQPAATSSTTGDTSKDVEINSQILPEDSVSDIAFSPAGEHLAVSSWDQKVRIYKITGSNVEPGWMFECEPAAGGAKENPLCVHWSAVCHLFEGQDASRS
jgi:WD40 repeat protein